MRFAMWAMVVLVDGAGGAASGGGCGDVGQGGPGTTLQVGGARTERARGYGTRARPSIEAVALEVLSCPKNEPRRPLNARCCVQHLA